jgi:hypothetical protein
LGDPDREALRVNEKIFLPKVKHLSDMESVDAAVKRKNRSTVPNQHFAIPVRATVSSQEVLVFIRVGSGEVGAVDGISIAVVVVVRRTSADGVNLKEPTCPRNI